MNERNLPVPPELGRLSTFIDSHTECLAGSSSELRSIALCAAKHIFDWALETEKSSKPHLGTLLATLTEAAPPQTRSRARNTLTQRRSPSPVQKPQKQIDIRDTPLPSLFIEGMNINQIWQQLDLRAARICENLRVLHGTDEDEDANLEGKDSNDGGSEDEDEDENEDEDEDEEMDIDDENLWEELSGGEEDDISINEDVANLQEEISEDEDDDEPPTSMLGIIRGQQKLNLPKSYSQGHSDLNDGFFDLATFNAETSEVESKEVSKRNLNFIVDEDSTEESEVDLFGPVDDSGIEGVDDGLAPTELFYNDFFEAPRQIQNKSIGSSKVRFHERVSVKKIKAVGKGMPVSSVDDEDSDEEEGNDFDDDGN